jgi:hypothetical protein
MRKLRVGAVLERTDVGHCVFVKIGGVGHSEVGYLYAPPTCIPPRVSADGFTYVGRVLPDWYLYRTD